MGSRLPPLSNTERASVMASLMAGVRMDSRALLENREVAVQFGKDFGCCTVSLGETRVLAQVTCEVVEPRPSRPNEGKIVTNVHITPMAGPEYEAGRTSDIQDELQQLLENNIRESRCLDLEALCIMAEESVWQLRADVTVLNACGNLGDACNLAVVAALKHFHRPEVTVEEDGRVTIHSFSERAPIPTFLKKVPVSLTYAFCSSEQEDEEEGGLVVLADPTNIEERVVRGRLVVGLNPHGEITSMNFPGPVMLTKSHITFCITNAFERAKAVAQLVDKLVEEDLQRRKLEVRPKGFVDKLISDEQIKRNKIDSKVAVMKSMSSQLRKVRDMFDASDKSQLDELRQQVKMEEGDSHEEESSNSSSDSSDSEFSDSDGRVLIATVPDEANKDDDITVLDSKCRKQLAITKDAGGDSDDSEEDVKESIIASAL